MATIEECKADPSKLNQVAGCCGFASTLMALLDRKSPMFDELVKYFVLGGMFHGIDMNAIANRVLKRRSAGIISSESQEDFGLCFVLMLLLKEYSKKNRLGVWERCVRYSELWNWKYRGMRSKGLLNVQQYDKLHDLPSGAKVGQDFEFLGLSYKKGDLAVPGSVMPTLLGLVDLKVQRQEPLIGDTAFQLITSLPVVFAQKWLSSFNTTVRNVQLARSTNGVDFNGIIIGVGNRPGEAAFETYNNVTHWVYAPTKPIHKQAPTGDFRIWTWEKEWDFWGEFVANKGYYPAYAIYLKK